jgi:hypothetical protein
MIILFSSFNRGLGDRQASLTRRQGRNARRVRCRPVPAGTVPVLMYQVPGTGTGTCSQLQNFNHSNMQSWVMH